MKSERSAVAMRMRSVRHAMRGIWTMLATQHNARIHAVATVAVIGAGFGFGVNTTEWCVLILVMTAVWTAETLNTALEFLSDVASPGFHPLVKKAKDVAAGAVLIAAIGAVMIGVLIFMPYILAAR